MSASFDHLESLFSQPIETAATDTLFSAARVIVDAGNVVRWTDGGGAVMARPCDPVTGLTPGCCDPLAVDPLPPALQEPGSIKVPAAEFVLGRKCVWMAHEELVASASQAVAKYGSQSVAAWWFGNVAAAAAPSAALPMPPENSLQYLIGLISTRQGASAGTIIATSQVVASWWRFGELIRDKAGKLRTAIGGHLVIADGGFNGVAPGNVAPAAGVSWAYAVGAVEVVVTPTVARSTDDSSAAARRRDNCNEGFASFYAAVVVADNCPPISVPILLTC